MVPSGGSLFGGEGKLLPISKVDEIKSVQGVKGAAAGIGVFVEDSGGFSFGAPDLVIGLDLAASQDILEPLKVDSGRGLEPDDRGKALVGATLAEKLGAEVGGTVELRGEEFEVAGVLQPTLPAPDTTALFIIK